MTIKDRISPEFLRAALRYDAESGRLFWLHRDDRRTGNKSWNAKHAGMEAFTHQDRSGYRRTNILGKSVAAHRAAWAIFFGEWPDGDIDHINRVKSDNRIENLRLATRSENCANSTKKSGASSIYRGVGWNERAKKWQARIAFNGMRKRLGLFSDEKDAAIAYDRAAKEIHGQFANPNFVETGNGY